MFEAIHGSAPQMVEEGRAIYADPASMLRAAAMLLNHLGYSERSNRLEMALDLCCQLERKVVITGRNTGVTVAAFTECLMETVQDTNLERKWKDFVKALYFF
jgi:isocitrate dehydrogenase (NAD+)